MNRTFSDRYTPENIEKKWIEIWENHRSFEPDLKQKESFSIVIPPPNVTGILHIGHALNHTLQDIIIRIERKKGKATLWVPGTDHAGIATQVVVERELSKQGIKRTDLTREEFEKRVWEWKTYSGGEITKQQRLLGESVDWSRERFTLDEGLSRAVTRVFVSLYKEGLIYKGERIINWCPSTKTAISDIEVEYRETNGFLYHIKYPILGRDGEFLTVATTRPETMLGDVAVCAHPDDPRYNVNKNMKLLLPLMNREIPLLYDNFVDKDFGSGLVKITPAHDTADFEAGQRLGLTPINIMNPDATLNENAGVYKGLDRFEARKKVIEDLKSLGYLEKIEPYTHSVGHNSRGGVVIEPYLSTQWFIQIKPLAEKAIETVRNGKIEFIPKMWEKTYFEWMENIKDWCISRQLWWGHRIPAYTCGDCGHLEVREDSIIACPVCGGVNVVQDPDVLDTWFSSGLWPFSVLGWPEKSEEGERFYPNSILVTGFDIIFFWVARMIMFGLKFRGDVPFRKVLIHGLVRDKNGKKFSKSLGNIIDPLDMMNKYGTDSFRFFLAASLPEGKDIIFDESRLEGYRAFCNKIWNSARFISMNLSENFHEENIDTKFLEATDLWIREKFNTCLTNYEKAYTQYHFYEMANLIYDFIWGDFCDWYLELTKHRIYGKSTEKSKQIALQNLVYVFKSSLHLLHPFMPFISEEINSNFSDSSLTTTKWPELLYISDEKEIEKINLLTEIVIRIRTVRSELSIPPDKKTKVFIQTQSEQISELLKIERNSILQMSRSESIEVDNNLSINDSDTVTPFSSGKIVIPMAGLIDKSKEFERLEKEFAVISQDLEKISKKIDNPDFISKAKPEVINREREKHKLLSEKFLIVKKEMEKFR